MITYTLETKKYFGNLTHMRSVLKPVKLPRMHLQCREKVFAPSCFIFYFFHICHT